jgi:alpha-L-fucosidase
MKKRNLSLICKQAVLALLLGSVTPLLGYDLPDLPAMPSIPARQPLGSVTLGDPANFPEVQMDFPIESGTFSPTWSSILANYPTKDSAWLRQAKLGIWVHFGPQAAGQSGDWYARRLYVETPLNTYGTDSYANHIRDYGHPSTVGYKDLIRTWNPTALDPAALTNTYFNAGARFLLVQGVHHDQFDNWNSRYQPWNSMNIGPHRDILGEWKTAIRAKGMHYGVTFHHEYTWWWWQSCYRADTLNTYGKQGVDYDGNLTNNESTALGIGQWWEGMDLRKLYTINLREYAGIYNGMDKSGYNLTQGIFTNHLEYAHWYATWWALRIMDVIENYDPDFIYTDGNSTQPFSGYMSGSGYKCDAMQRVLAHYFNRTQERRGSVDTFSIIKFNPYNRGVVNTYESTYPSGIVTSQPWIGEVPVGDWFYNTGFNYDPGMVIRYLLECVSRDGAAAICIALKPDGSLDPGSVTQLAAVGNWMTINSPGIYGSRAWVLKGEGSNNLPTGALGSSQANATFTTSDFRYTVGADGYLYAYCMKVPSAGATLTLTALGTGDGYLAAPITSVELLGGTTSLTWSQSATALSITCPASMPFQTAVCFKIGPTSIVAPPVPSDLIAAPTNSSVVLNWSSPLSTATFNVKRATSLSGTYSTIATGLTATTYTDTTAAPDTPYFYVVTATQDSVTSANSAVAPAILAGTTTWLTQDIGAVGASGALVQSGSSMLINGSGADIWGTADEFRYVYQALSGDGTITARVECLQNTDGWAKAGLMIRESLNANSRYAIAFMSPSNGTALQQRTSTGGSASGVAGTTGLSAPYWLRLKRSGTTFTAYQSADGVTWTTLGTTTISMATDVYVGLAVGSHNDGAICQALFSNVSVKTGAIPDVTATAGNGNVTLRWNALSGASAYRVKRATTAGGPYTTIVPSTPGTAYIDTGLTNGTTYYYVVSSLANSVESENSGEVSGTPASSATLVSRASGGTATANAEKATETAAMAFDGSTSTKWYTDVNASTGWLQYQFGNGLAWRITQYKITSANDVQQRDPKSWQFQGSNDGATWSTLDTRTGETFASRLLTKTYDLTNTTPNRYYRLNITDSYGGSGYPIQLSEFAMLSAPTDVSDKTPPVLTLPSSMTLSASNSAGMVVTFSATATDVVSGTLNVTSAPASGSLFSPGTTAVQCSAIDLLANTGTGSFNITVNSPVMTWRLLHFGTSDNSGDAADSADPDGDGWNNAQEFTAGTDPKDGVSLLKVSQMQASGSDMVVSFPTVSGKTYRVERSDTLQSGSWSVVQENIAGTGSTMQVTDSGGAAQTKRFYRIVVQ